MSLNLGGQYSFTRTQQTFGANVAEAKDFFEDSSDEERQHLSAGYIAANWKIGKSGALELSYVWNIQILHI